MPTGNPRRDRIRTRNGERTGLGRWRLGRLLFAAYLFLFAAVILPRHHHAEASPSPSHAHSDCILCQASQPSLVPAAPTVVWGPAVPIAAAVPALAMAAGGPQARPNSRAPPTR